MIARRHVTQEETHPPQCRAGRIGADDQAAMAIADQAVAIIDRYGDLPALRTEEVLLHAGWCGVVSSR